VARRWSVLAAGLLLAAGALVGAVIAEASIPGPDGVIHGCYKNSNPAQGALLTIDSAASCPSGYTALNWNQTGPQGPAGTNGVSGYEFVREEFRQPGDVQWPVGIPHEFIVTCPTGKVALGGGFDASEDGGGAGPSLVSSYPIGEASPGSGGRWQVGIDPTTSLSYVAVFATCANVN